ncbi:MAG: metalloregulator ArsR/SmtB family transcription factor [Candidatus Bathyarchaeota archaeon]|nr:metalloregulator ArsR/SmtB family transcription factor [Candidatus Bathyarchaeota archaeon]
MKPIQVLRDLESFKLLADGTRRKILYLLRVKEMTVGQLAAELGITPQALYHHIKKLLDGKMVEIVREERVGHLIESYYRATAEDFLLMTGKLRSQTFRDRKLAKDQMISCLSALRKLDFDLEFDENKISQLVDLRAGLTDCCKDDERSTRIIDGIWNMDNLDLLTQQIASDLAGTLLMSDREFAGQQETRKKLRDLLLSLIKK